MCGVFGVFGHAESANITYLGLHALQHRGQESAGIVTTDGHVLYAHRAMGLVQDAFTQEQLGKLPGRSAIGHVRYSTAGGSHIKNAQPIAVDWARGSLAVCHNGNLTNADELRAELEARGSIFQSDSDTEVFVHLVAASKEIAVEDRIADALTRVKGAYSLLFMTEEAVIGVRDPMGIRPLCLGLLPGHKDAHVLASEPCAFDLIGAEYVRDIEPGEMVIIDGSGMRSIRPMPSAPRRMCLFEYVYFARPDSKLGGRSVYEVRKALGATLAREAPIDADVVVPVPDSGVPSAIGYAAAQKMPFELGLIRSHYVGRTFIEPQQSIRHFGVRLKLNPVEFRCCAESAWSSSTTRSCAARRRARSSRWCATPERGKCTSASRVRRRSGPVTTASTRPPAASSSPRATRSTRSRATSRRTRLRTCRSTA